MPKKNAFISHASRDDAFVKALRQALEMHGAAVWADSRELVAGDLLQPVIQQAIAEHEHFLLVVSNNASQSKWVKKELEHARSLQKRIVALLLDGQTVGALAWIFDEEPLAVQVSAANDGLQGAMPEILAALGLRLPGDAEPAEQPAEPPVNELLLVLADPRLYTEGGRRRGQAQAHLEMHPADGGDAIETPAFDFVCPLGPIEAGRMKWYIEDYPQAPFLEKILDRGAELEKEMEQWGKALFDALTDAPDARQLFWEWKGDNVHERRFSVKFNFFDQKNLPAEKLEAINLLLATPWEILHDGAAYLFQGKKPVRVRRRIPNKGKKASIVLQNKLRVLLLSPRPVDKHARYIDHRVSPKALLAAIEPLGDRAELTLLDQPTFPALCAAIRDAEQAGRPFSVVHFDGHGVFDAHRGLGALCFESAEAGEQEKLLDRQTHIVYADELLEELRGYRIPFFFLDACQSAVAEKDPTASVAATLLETGAASVAAMSYSVLVTTAAQFAKTFYAELARGARIGSAMLAGQRALAEDRVRAHLPGGEKLELHDWFVPVLFQEEKDPQLVRFIPGKAARAVAEQARKALAGATPEPPPHGFIGRRLELLALERLLLLERFVVLVGTGGAGKTTLAAELARWLLATRRTQRLAFVSFEGLLDIRGAIDVLGKQLEGPDFSVAAYEQVEKAMLVIDRRLREYRTLLVLDNLESILPGPDGAPLPGVAPVVEFTAFFQRLLDGAPGTQLLMTSREQLPEPFDVRRNTIRLGALAPDDALHLIAEVLKRENIPVPSLNAEDLDKEFGALARTANYHARALTLLTRLLAERGDALPDLNADLSRLMAELERKYPGQRENSLFASLELSLQRLPADMRELVDALAVYHGGADVATWAMVAEKDQDMITGVGMALVKVGLAELALDKFPHFFKVDPALPTYLSERTPPDLLEARRERWVEGMVQLGRFLRNQQFADNQLASDLCLLTESNLLAMLTELDHRANAEQIVGAAQQIEDIFSPLGRSQIVFFAQSLREKAAALLMTWSHMQYLHNSATVDRLLEQGNLNAALETAKALLEKCIREGEYAYQGAAFDGASAYFSLGRVLQMSGHAEQALPLLAESRRRFLILAETGSDGAKRMASVCLTEMGDCFLDLGQYEAAAHHYDMSREIAEKSGDLRQVAVDVGQLATARRHQKNYQEALRLYAEAKAIFEKHREPASVAISWHQIGITHQEIGNFPAAEKAYQESLAIKIREKNKSGEAASLGQLGNLYDEMGKLEDAVRMYERSAAIYAELGQLFKEGTSRHNLADTLIKLSRPDEARMHLKRAIACNDHFGHAAEPWKTWKILYNLEIGEENKTAAANAHEKAAQTYFAYRKDGGESQSNRFQLILASGEALQSGQGEQFIEYLQSTLEPTDSIEYIALVRALTALLRGQRDPALADDPELHYMDAAELRLAFFGG